MQDAEGKGVQEPEPMLNYDQYYPTLLPLRQPGMEETDTEANARDDRPPDLFLHKVCLVIYVYFDTHALFTTMGQQP